VESLDGVAHKGFTLCGDMLVVNSMKMQECEDERIGGWKGKELEDMSVQKCGWENAESLRMIRKHRLM